jgi:dipeptidyl aminopeptidase/acylaminoacyl peptidase
MQTAGIIAAIIAGLIVLAAISISMVKKKTVLRPVSLGNTKYDVQVKRIDVPSGNRMLYGQLMLPGDGKRKHPTIICSHGFNGSYRYFRDGAGMCLAMSGYAVYCFDFYAGSVHSRSGGDTREMNVFDEREQLNNVIAFIRRQDFCDTGALFIWGESQGGFVTAITAAQHTEDVRAVVLFYPAFCLGDDFFKRYAALTDMPETVRWMGVPVSRRYYEGLLDFDPYAEAGKYKGPVLIVHGDADKTVNLTYGMRARDAYKNARLEVLSGEDHGFSANGKLKAAEIVYHFLEETGEKK